VCLKHRRAHFAVSRVRSASSGDEQHLLEKFQSYPCTRTDSLVALGYIVIWVEIFRKRLLRRQRYRYHHPTKNRNNPIESLHPATERTAALMGRPRRVCYSYPAFSAQSEVVGRSEWLKIAMWTNPRMKAVVEVEICRGRASDYKILRSTFEW
jgi:hypothetical protein